MFQVQTFIYLAVCLLSTSAFAQQVSPIPFSIPPADAPELAPRGSYPVGVRTLELVHKDQIDVLHFDKQTGRAPSYERPLAVEIWYPAVIPTGQLEATTYRMPVPGGHPVAGLAVIEIPDKALRDAPPVKGQQFPLVIVSHGYPGSRYFLSYLTSNLASKGYVVAAIDHTDSVFDGLRGFESTLLNRSNDQLFAIDSIDRLAREPDHFLHGLTDTSRVAIVGYSMGGYGALTSAGAGYSKSSALVKLVPGGYLENWEADSKKFRALERTRVKAVVAIAPWGEQPPYSAWDAQGLAGIHIPTLFIAGDHDDVADYANGIKPAFEHAINSERCMLVYENARHNTGGNPAPVGVSLTYPTLEAFNEPAWRKDRITSINQHFITAFLDLYLKEERNKAAYLHLNPERSNDGKWTVPPAQNDTGVFSSGKDADGNAFWKGFQRRNAVGLEMYCYAAGQPR
ncbi:MAG: prolyl oligopeptidase family serine peptidase [Acidobacteriota bacterium]|nr:prolyl oligopeptidase family serine peptidase [Acidobacteriota bacterium]